MAAEFKLLANPEVLVMICGVLAAFFGLTAGATALGGLAFGTAVGRMLGIALMVPQLKEYESLFRDLGNALKSDKQEDFFKGAYAFQRLLYCLLRDVTMALGLSAAGKIATLAGQKLKNLFVKHSPKEWQKLAEEASVPTKKKVQSAGPKYGFAREDLLKKADRAKYFLKGESNVFLSRCRKEGELIAVREPVPERLAVIKAPLAGHRANSNGSKQSRPPASGAL